MRVTRAFVASFGAGLSVVAASVTLLFLLSAIVAVKGWPGIDPDDDVQRVTLADARLAPGVPAPAGEGVVAVAAAAGDSAPVVLGGADPRPSAPTRRDRGDDGGGDRGGPAPGGAPVAGEGPSVSRPGAPAAGAPAPAPSRDAGSGTARPAPAPAQRPGPVEQVSSGVGDAVQDAGEVAGDTVEPVAPGTAPVVTQVTDTVAETVESTGKAVDDVTEGDVDGAVKDVGDAVGGLLGGKRD